MNIIYTCDNNFVWIMGISMISLFENNKECDDIHVYLLGDAVTEDNKSILDDIANKYHREFTLINIPNLKIPSQLSSKRWPKSAFTRLFAGELMPIEIEKALYLDCDTIIKENIADVFNTSMTEYAISGIKDCVSKPYKRKVGIVEGDSYINGGVLLMNLNKLREYDIREMMGNFISEFELAISYADQDILNGMFKGKFGILPPQYDLMTLVDVYSYNELEILRHPDHYYSKAEIAECKKNPKIIHYTTCMLNIRPWCEGSNHSYAWLFDNYKAISPWADKPKAIARFDTGEYKVIKAFFRLPRKMALFFLGLIHAYIRPIWIMTKAKIK